MLGVLIAELLCMRIVRHNCNLGFELAGYLKTEGEHRKSMNKFYVRMRVRWHD